MNTISQIERGCKEADSDRIRQSAIDFIKSEIADCGGPDKIPDARVTKIQELVATHNIHSIEVQ